MNAIINWPSWRWHLPQEHFQTYLHQHAPHLKIFKIHVDEICGSWRPFFFSCTSLIFASFTRYALLSVMTKYIEKNTKTISIPGIGGACWITWGKSKLIPLMEGYWDVMALIVWPRPPPTSTSCWIFSKPLYFWSIFLIVYVDWSYIALLKISLNLGSTLGYSNACISCTLLNGIPPSSTASFNLLLRIIKGNDKRNSKGYVYKQN